MSRDLFAELSNELRRLEEVNGGREGLVSSLTVQAGIRSVLEELHQQRDWLTPEDPRLVATLAVVRKLRANLLDATTEWVSTTRAHHLTGWSLPTLRKYGERMVRGLAPERGWETLVARRDERGDFSFVLASIPPRSDRTEIGSRSQPAAAAA